MRRGTRRGTPRRGRGGGALRKLLILVTAAFVCLGVVYFARITRQSWVVLQQHRVHGRSLWQLFKARLWEEDLPAPSRSPRPGRGSSSTPRKRQPPPAGSKKQGPPPRRSSLRRPRKGPSRPRQPPSQSFSPRDRAKLDGILRKSLQPKPKGN
ncbi:MAG: hypothetical protein AAF471_06425 [Myxococcota bacterium]